MITIIHHKGTGTEDPKVLAEFSKIELSPSRRLYIFVYGENWQSQVK